MSVPRPLRDRLQSNSPEPEPPHPTTPLRITKHSSPQPRQGLSPRHPSDRPPVQVARRTSNSFKHVRDNNLVTKSPFRTLIPQALAATAPSPRRVSGEKRPRPDSMHALAESDRPLGFKRRQSKGFQGLLQKEPVTKSPFRRSSELSSSSSSEPVPPVSLKLRAYATAIPVSSPIRGVLAQPRKLHGPRGVGDRYHKQKTVTFDDNCEVVELSDCDYSDDEPEGVADVSFDDEGDGYGYGYTYQETVDKTDDILEDDLEPEDQLVDDSITGMVDSMLEATRPHTPPNPEEEEDAGLLPPSPSPAKSRTGSSDVQRGSPTACELCPPNRILQQISTKL